MSSNDPTTEPAGELVPPHRGPPTALATATPPPPRHPVRQRRSSGGILATIRRVTLDLLDIADRIAARVTGSS